MAKIKNITDNNDYSTFDSFEDEIDIVITTDKNIDDAISQTLERQLDGEVDSPISEALREAEEKLNFNNNGDKSLNIVIDPSMDCGNVAPGANFLDMDADDVRDAEEDMFYDPLDDDDIIDIVQDIK